MNGMMFFKRDDREKEGVEDAVVARGKDGEIVLSQ